MSPPRSTPWIAGKWLSAKSHHNTAILQKNEYEKAIKEMPFRLRMLVQDRGQLEHQPSKSGYYLNLAPLSSPA